MWQLESTLKVGITIPPVQNACYQFKLPPLISPYHISCGFVCLFVLVAFHFARFSISHIKGPPSPLLNRQGHPSLPFFSLKVYTSVFGITFKSLFPPKLTCCWLLTVSLLPQSVVGIHCILFMSF